ncbi:hybrid sensor histidine kinase/response regulator [Sphingomonas sp.]|jgi:two-component system cell cycle sensor histidine kinase/response regulator CckA|uniref:hybrid sensor histidine kinase/response regulator n=1 Tax=Sphingomonas sp. TaxID=28214 RepID=UPI002E0F15A3|nr:response regulator [Sphingomonas sp.]
MATRAGPALLSNGRSETGGSMTVLVAVGAAALATGLLVFLLLGHWLVAAGFVAGAVAVGVALSVMLRRQAPAAAFARSAHDWSLIRAAIDDDSMAMAVTNRRGGLVCANDCYARWFDGYAAPAELPLGDASAGRLREAEQNAWRDGAARIDGLRRDAGTLAAELTRVGAEEDHLLWRFRPVASMNLLSEARRMIGSEAGERLGEAGIMGVLIAADGRIGGANRAFALRATGSADAAIGGRDLGTLLTIDKRGLIRFEREGPTGGPVRLLQVPLDPNDRNGATLIFLIDDDGAPRLGEGSASSHIQTLLSMLPLGFALADRDGRFLFLNDAFARVAGIDPGSKPVYPSDLVVREDKAAVADTVRRFASGPPMSGDIAIRLQSRPDDPVALSIAGARGLGEAAVLLSLKDNAEESRLKRQVAQATKMQAVGQLAGGVAHDFNNILTAIIGHCDLMLMRHTPGDSDYDDIQQIRANSNRAASLTRQLLAFSRQQTLRPQVLQLPDVVSDVFNLLKRLLGETVTLNVKHGRNLGSVRADPGQLEQVIVNLAVNARDAMPEGGVLTLQTYAVSAADVRRMKSEIMPIVDYTAISITDTGTGIPPDVLPKIFEPFFTTKEVGKGTGLGLSTVYGIVKQSNGFIFADSVLGQGTSFVIYLPVHKAEPVAEPATPQPKERPAELWGSGTILLVEDEAMVRAVAERALTRQGYKVVTAGNGEEALECLEAGESFDLLISDVVMPTMDGPTLVRHARAKYPELPILFMSGYAEEQLRKSIDIENVAFLPKPFSVQQLAEAARAALAAK